MRAWVTSLCIAAVTLCFSGAAGGEDRPTHNGWVVPVDTSEEEKVQVAEQSGPASGADTIGVTQLPEVVVEGRVESLIGAADTASEGTVGAQELQSRPLQRPGEVLETVPGVIVTQHSGSGKANQASISITAPTSPPAWMAYR